MKYLFLIAIILILFFRNEELKNEIIKLKSEINKLKKDNGNNTSSNYKYCPMCGFNLQDKERVSFKVEQQEEEKPVVKENKIERPKKTVDPTELKNSTILIVGAILIVISAIVFLTTTWNTSLDIVKTIVVLLMFFVFLGFSYIADKRLHLKETSRAFFYIALSYLPLVFLSISLFKLFGEYLSISGEGRYIYLSISSIIITIIYYGIMKKRRDLFTTIGGIIFQIISIALFVLIFTNRISIILIALLVHQLIYLFLYINKKYYLNEQFHKKFNDAYLIILFTINIIFFIILGINNIDFNLIIILLMYYLVFYTYLLVINNKKQDFNIIGPIIITLIFLIVSHIYNKGFVLYQITSLLSVTIIYFIDYLRSNEIKEESFIITSINLIIIYILSLTLDTVIPSYLIMLIYSLFFIINSSYLRKGKDLLQKTISIPIFILVIDVVLTLKLEILIIPVLAIIALLISNLIHIKNDNIRETLPSTAITYSMIAYFMTLPTYINNYNILLVLSLLYSFIYLYISIVRNNNIHRIISYILYYFW